MTQQRMNVPETHAKMMANVLMEWEHTDASVVKDLKEILVI